MREEVISIIDIDQLTNDDVGRWVLYGDGFKEEYGRIKSWNDKFVFVVYKCDRQWQRFEEFTSCATNPEDLRFIEEGEFTPL